MGGGRVKNCPKLCDVIYGRPPKSRDLKRFCSRPKKPILIYLATLKLLFLAWLVILNGIIFFLAKFGDPFTKVGDPKKGRDTLFENHWVSNYLVMVDIKFHEFDIRSGWRPLFGALKHITFSDSILDEIIPAAINNNNNNVNSSNPASPSHTATEPKETR